MKIFLRLMFMSSVQIVFFILLATYFWNLGNSYHGELRGGISDGMAFYYSHHLFTILALANSANHLTAPSKKRIKIGTLACIGLFILYFSTSYSRHPYRSILIVALGTLCLSLPLFYNKIRSTSRPI